MDDGVGNLHGTVTRNNMYTGMAGNTGAERSTTANPARKKSRDGKSHHLYIHNCVNRLPENFIGAMVYRESPACGQTFIQVTVRFASGTTDGD